MSNNPDGVSKTKHPPWVLKPRDYGTRYGSDVQESSVSFVVVKLFVVTGMFVVPDKIYGTLIVEG